MINLDIEFRLNSNGTSTELLLASTRQNSTSNLQILEDDDVSFLLISSKPLSNPILWTQDVSHSVTLEERSKNGLYEYYWYQDDPPLFRNHFGYSEITIEIDEETYRYTVIEVLARKINADNTQNILRYLEDQITGITNFCFSLTHQRADSDGIGSSSPQQIMQEIRSGIQNFTDAIPQFISRRRTRLISTPKLVNWDEATSFSERSIEYVLTHPDSLTPSNNKTRAIKVGRKNYMAQTIETDIIGESTDVYENRVITGYFETCAITLGKIETFYRDFMSTLEKQEEPRHVPLGYQSILNIRKHFGTRYSEKMLKECQDLQRSIVYCADFMRRNLYVTRPVFGIPQATPGFLTSTHYRRLFERIVSFYRLGALNTNGNQFLYNLRTLDKLYEFFCLYRLIESLDKIGFKLERTEYSQKPKQTPLFTDTQPADIYTFARNSALRLTLFYEKSYYEKKAKSLSNTIFVKQRNSRKLIPDYFIEIYDGSSYAYLILDAKYTTPKLAKELYLPDLTMKYYHGLGTSEDTKPPCIGIFALYPRQGKDEIYHFHKDNFNIFSNKPSLPALGTLSVDPESDSINLSKLLSQVISIFISHFKS